MKRTEQMNATEKFMIGGVLSCVLAILYATASPVANQLQRQSVASPESIERCKKEAEAAPVRVGRIYEPSIVVFDLCLTRTDPAAKKVLSEQMCSALKRQGIDPGSLSGGNPCASNQ
jgi:hypothetical protein